MQPNSKVDSKDLNEQMYLVVRSLKHNNNKVVIPFPIPLIYCVPRSTISSRATF